MEDSQISLTVLHFCLNCFSAGSIVHGFLLPAGCSGSQEPAFPDNFKSKLESGLEIRSSFLSTVNDTFEQEFVVTYDEEHTAVTFFSFGRFSRKFFSDTDDHS